MNREELVKKLEDIEWEDFEVKEAKTAVPKSSWETVSAFSNTAGGWLVFGVKKSGKKYSVTGIVNLEKIEQNFTTTLRGDKFNKKIQVKSRKYKIDGNDILAFYIPSASSKDKPVYFNSLNNTFIRTGSGDQRATKNEIDSIYRHSSFDKKDKEVTDLTIKDLDAETIENYRTYLKNREPEHRYNKFSDEKLLSKLEVLKGKKVTIGGLLVFGKEDSISEIISDFRIDHLEIMGKSYTDAPERYTYRLPQEKNLFNYYFSILERLIKKIDIPFKLKGTFRDENPPQLIAVREALVNLLMHNDYFSNAKPRIRSFIDRIEFFNPGSLPKSIEQIIKEDFSLPRNQVIAKIFRVIRLSENIGSGFHKMIEGWKEYYKVTPEITGDIDYYKIVFGLGNKGISEGLKKGGQIGGQIGGQKITTRQKEILDIIKKKPTVSRGELSDLLKINPSAVQKHINKLKEKGIIKRIGKTLGGYWEINEQ